MKKKIKNIIFSNIDVNREDYREGWKEFLELNGLDERTNTLDDYVSESISQWFEDEQTNLDKSVNVVIAIADLGSWDGRHHGYKLIPGNLNQILSVSSSTSDGGCFEVYSDGKDVKATIHHHDGTNFLTFREIRSDRNNYHKLLNAIIREEETPELIRAYTRSLVPMVNAIYGWKK